jgi:hypothetical protein
MRIHAFPTLVAGGFKKTKCLGYVMQHSSRRIPRQDNSCPTGFYKSGNYYKASGGSDKQVINREPGAKCPTGWYKSYGNARNMASEFALAYIHKEIDRNHRSSISNTPGNSVGIGNSIGRPAAGIRQNSMYYMVLAGPRFGVCIYKRHLESGDKGITGPGACWKLGHVLPSGLDTVDQVWP